MMRRRRIALLALAGHLLLATALTAQIPASEFAARRATLLDIHGDGVIIVLGAAAAAEDYLPWRQARPFLYLTGVEEPDAALVIAARGGMRREILFVHPRDPSQEVWSGPRLGPEGVVARLGIEGRPLAALKVTVDSLLADTPRVYLSAEHDEPGASTLAHRAIVDRLLQGHGRLSVIPATPAINSMRGRKSEAELERLRVAAEISARGHLDAFRVIQPGVGEFEIQAAAEHRWRREGADGPGYMSIVGSGPNATILHYNASSRVARAGELVLMDMAAAFDGYSADITRTVPVSGRFSAPQREIYEVVLAAQKAAERQVRVGADARLMSDSAGAELARGLARLGLIEAADARYECGDGNQRRRPCSQLSLFYMHGLGHAIGLDVHDHDQYYDTGTIGLGSAFTIEPGIYVREGLAGIVPDTPRNREMLARIAPALARYEGIGVRIEDDYLVTARGLERVSSGVPREIEEIERLMAEPRTPRDPSVTERFLRLRTWR